MRFLVFSLAVLVMSCGSLQKNESLKSITGKYEGYKDSRHYTLKVMEDGKFYYSNRGQFHSLLFSDGQWKLKNNRLILNSRDSYKEGDVGVVLANEKWLNFTNKVYLLKKKGVKVYIGNKPLLKKIE